MPEVDESHSPQRHHPYEGAGFSIMGDSISTLAGWVPEGWRVHYQGEVRIDGVELPEDTWWGRVIGHFGGHLVGNSSFSGATVEAAEGFGFPAGDSDERVRALAGTDGELPDVVIVFMGINDYGWGGARNQAMGRSAAASSRPEDLAGPREVTATADVDALARLCEHARPDQEVGTRSRHLVRDACAGKCAPVGKRRHCGTGQVRQTHQPRGARAFRIIRIARCFRSGCVGNLLEVPPSRHRSGRLQPRHSRGGGVRRRAHRRHPGVRRRLRRR